ncbi:hypothetical protein HK102_006944, partial [Quaeritorhiza haematococci]
RVRSFIAAVWDIFSIKTFLDAPCGDCNWQPSIEGFENVMYTGADIVPQLIIKDMRKYINKLNMRFVNLDLVIDKVPQGFDAIMCRDAIQHLPLKDGEAIYKNFEASGAKFLITNFHNTTGNWDISPGSWYANNPMLPPFNFPPPLFYIVDADDGFLSSTKDWKYMGVWRLPALHRGQGVAIEPDVDKARRGVVPVGEESERLMEKYQAKKNGRLNDAVHHN